MTATLEKMTISEWFESHTKEQFIEEFDKCCTGRWEMIFQALGCNEALESYRGGYKHVGCPRHDGKTSTNFRIIKQSSKHGKCPFPEKPVGVCNSCGTFVGLQLLCWHLGKEGEYSEVRKMIMNAMNWTWGYVLNEPRLDAALTEAEYAEMRRKAKKQEQEATAKRIEREKALYEKDIRVNKFLKSELTKLFKTCIPIHHPNAKPARLYYSSRGIPTAEDLGKQTLSHIRYTEKYHLVINKIDYGYWSAIVSKITNIDNELLNVHAIFIDEKGNTINPTVTINGTTHEAPSKVKSPAMNRMNNEGRAIRPFKPNLIQAVCEGQEVGMIVNFFEGLPVDMAGDANSMEAWLPQNGVKLVFILADFDTPSTNHPSEGGNGLSSAFKLQDKLLSMGVVAIVVYPDFDIPENSKSVDWNDVYACFGTQYAPIAIHNWRQLEKTLEVNFKGVVTSDLLEAFSIPESGVLTQTN
ncbi:MULTISPECIES: hypothetical protein [Vibrio]|uniref:hypothetical protein n=1 Tax=Vibrio TaxID=662 RepID=UPI001E651D9C|nr:hypothetical protein [Vibrio lentus]MCC4837995.1 hypothetical protein [Vibrio lentus]